MTILSDEDFKSQTAFTKNILAVHGAAGKQWLQELPAHIDVLARQWNFKFLRACAELSWSFAALVEVEGETRILKIAFEPLENEVRWLQAFNQGVPQVFNAERNAFLMENLVPGTPLKSLVNDGYDDEATTIIAEIILNLQSEQIPHSGFKHLSELSESLPVLKGHLKNSMISKAVSLFHDLCDDWSADVLLHGDLHHDNILQCGASWKAIDPHGYVGDAAAEVGAMIRNPFDCFPADKPLRKILDRRLQILAEMLPFDPERIKAWAFCMTALSAAWDVEGHAKISENTYAVLLGMDQIQR
jgi:streptomycin 6-kinase